eukprot:jgi/Mesvir1/7741/Mv11685-RA.1
MAENLLRCMDRAGWKTIFECVGTKFDRDMKNILAEIAALKAMLPVAEGTLRHGKSFKIGEASKAKSVVVKKEEKAEKKEFEIADIQDARMVLGKEEDLIEVKVTWNNYEPPADQHPDVTEEERWIWLHDVNVNCDSSMRQFLGVFEKTKSKLNKKIYDSCTKQQVEEAWDEIVEKRRSKNAKKRKAAEDTDPIAELKKQMEEMKKAHVEMEASYQMRLDKAMEALRESHKNIDALAKKANMPTMDEVLRLKSASSQDQGAGPSGQDKGEAVEAKP